LLGLLSLLEFFLDSARNDLFDSFNAGLENVLLWGGLLLGILFLAFLEFIPLLRFDFLLRELLAAILPRLRLRSRLTWILEIGLVNMVLVGVFLALRSISDLALLLRQVPLMRFAALSTAVRVLTIALIDACRLMAEPHPTRRLVAFSLICRTVCKGRLARLKMLTAWFLLLLGHGCSSAV